MKFKQQDQLLNKIKQVVLHRTSEEQHAVFDADGTLWLEDANQILLDYQIQKEKENSFKKLANSNPSVKSQNFQELLKDYYQIDHRHELCQSFLKKQAGFSLAEFQAQVEKALSQQALTVLPFQRELLAYLKKQGLKIVVITASIQWLVELAVKKEKLPVDQVIGCRAELKKTKQAGEVPQEFKSDLLISEQLVQPSPAKDSKAEVFLKEYPKSSCLLAAGNTLSDLPLLELASLPFVVNSAGKDQRVFSAEQKMKEKALEKQWILFEKEES